MTPRRRTIRRTQDCRWQRAGMSTFVQSKTVVDDTCRSRGTPFVLSEPRLRPA